MARFEKHLLVLDAQPHLFLFDYEPRILVDIDLKDMIAGKSVAPTMFIGALTGNRAAVACGKQVSFTSFPT